MNGLSKILALVAGGVLLSGLAAYAYTNLTVGGAGGTVWTTPTLNDVTNAGNTTVNAITVGSVSSTQFIANPGSAAAPSFTFSGETGTGLYLSSSNQITITTNSAARVSFGSDTVFATPLLPSITNSKDLGSGLFSWRNIYASGTAYVGTDVISKGSANAPQKQTVLAGTTASTTLAVMGSYMYVSSTAGVNASILSATSSIATSTVDGYALTLVGVSDSACVTLLNHSNVELGMPSVRLCRGDVVSLKWSELLGDWLEEYPVGRLNNLWNGTKAGYPGGDQIYGGVDDYNAGAAAPSDRYAGPWTQCAAADNYCSTGDSGAAYRDDSTGLIWSMPCKGAGCSSFSDTAPDTYAFTTTTYANNWSAIQGRYLDVGTSTAYGLCQGGDHGKTGWLTPTQKQLMQAYIDGSYGNLDGGVTRLYWSSTTYSNSPPYAWLTSLSLGYTVYYAKADPYYVRCVR